MIKISCCIITQNKAERLAEALRKIHPLVDEIIVVDGGSQDNTQEVAKKLGAKVFFRQWDDNFGAQKNFAIKKSSNEWVLSLDDDESIKFNRGYNFQKLIKDNSENDAFQFVRSNFLDNQKTNSVGDFDKQIRLFKRYCRFIHKIHEIPKGYRNLKEVESEKCLILHYKTRLEQKEHLLFQRRIMENIITKLEKKERLTPEEDKTLTYEKKLLKLWDTWWEDTKK